jgi:F-type H+-transporting ATPase subunit a
VAPAVFMALHVFVSLLQAYIFMLLPAVYISMAVSEEH